MSAPKTYVIAEATPTIAIDPTANWKTYVHPTLNYSFSYPENLPLEIYNDKVVVRIDPPDPRLIVGICPRYISFSTINTTSKLKTIQDEYSCEYSSSIIENKIFVESQSPKDNQGIVDQIISTFQFTK